VYFNGTWVSSTASRSLEGFWLNNDLIEWIWPRIQSALSLWNCCITSHGVFHSCGVFPLCDLEGLWRTLRQWAFLTKSPTRNPYILPRSMGSVHWDGLPCTDSVLNVSSVSDFQGNFFTLDWTLNRLAFVTLKNNLMVLSLRAMMMQFIILMMIAADFYMLFGRQWHLVFVGFTQSHTPFHTD